jgi:hypothetical protein
MKRKSDASTIPKQSQKKEVFSKVENTQTVSKTYNIKKVSNVSTVIPSIKSIAPPKPTKIYNFKKPPNESCNLCVEDFGQIQGLLNG